MVSLACQGRSIVSGDGYIEKQCINLVGEVLGRETGDIEDVFEEDENLKLYSKAFGKSVTAEDLNGNDPIAAWIVRHEGVTTIMADLQM